MISESVVSIHTSTVRQQIVVQSVSAGLSCCQTGERVYILEEPCQHSKLQLPVIGATFHSKFLGNYEPGPRSSHIPKLARCLQSGFIDILNVHFLLQRSEPVLTMTIYALNLTRK